MNIYKFRALVKEFSFLDKILRKEEDSIYHEGYEDRIQSVTSFCGEEPGFRMEKDGKYFIPSYLQVPDSLVVKRGDENLLARTPTFDSYSWCDGGHHDHDSYCAVVKDGDDFQCCWLKEEGSSRTGSGDHDEQSARSITEQLFQLGINPEYIVRYNFQDTDDSGNGAKTIDVVIYKMKNFNLVDHHCKQIDKVACELKAEITAVCSGGGE